VTSAPIDSVWCVYVLMQWLRDEKNQFICFGILIEFKMFGQRKARRFALVGNFMFDLTSRNYFVAHFKHFVNTLSDDFCSLSFSKSGIKLISIWMKFLRFIFFLSIFKKLSDAANLRSIHYFLFKRPPSRNRKLENHVKKVLERDPEDISWKTEVSWCWKVIF
jgi:hypothetical protein